MTLTCSVSASLPGDVCSLQQEASVLVICEDCATTGVGERTIEQVTLSAFPNPVARGTTTIAYAVPAEHAGSRVELTIYDVSGRVVRHLTSGAMEMGEYSVAWDLRADDGAVVSAGVYFSHLLVGPEKRTQRLLVIR
jgi:flagellar hook assembly protein FlgD